MEEENDQTVLILHVDETGKAQFPYEHSDGERLRGLLEEDHSQKIKQIKLECLEDVLPEPVCEIDDPTADAAGNMIQVEEVLGGMGLGLEQVDAIESMDVATSKDIKQDFTIADDGEEVVIVQHMDIREPLWKLRKLLEQRLNLDLSACQFWLQNKQMLEPHKNLVDQCVQGEGLVRINVEIKVEGSVQKINVLDILEPDASFEEATEPEEPPSPDKQQVSVSWVQDLKFKKEQEKLGIPADPNLWQPAHVLHWLQWAVRCFNLVGIKVKDWNMTGVELCKMTMQEFQAKVPLDPQELFWTHLEVLRKCKFVAVVQNEEEGQQKTAGGAGSGTGIGTGVGTGSINIATRLVQQPKTSPPQIRGKLHGKIARATKIPKSMSIPLGSMDSTSTCGNRTGNNGQIQLWQFLLELLTDKDHRGVIQWIGIEGEFKLLNPEMVAQLWGERKNKPTMNYEKLSRALRYYYDGDMISKVPNKRFVYKFVCDLKQLLGYSASELNNLVIEYERKTLGYNPSYSANAISADA